MPLKFEACDFSLANSRATAWVCREIAIVLEVEHLMLDFAPYIFRPEIRRGYPPNLSILISGGKENNRDALSNGE